MMDATKYQIGYYPPPVEPGHVYEWMQKDHIETAPAWCSVDLRDGNQSLVVPMSLEEKLEFYEMLLKIGFKEIEVGFPAASETEYEFLRKLIDEDRIPQDVTIQVGVRSSGQPPGRPLIITTVSTPSCSARRNVPSATALSPAPFSPGNRGLPEQFRAEIVRPFSPRVSSSRCRAPASAVSPFRSTWGAGDQLPQPSSTCSSPSPRQTAAASARERSARLSVTKPSFMSIPPPSSFLIP